MHEFPKAITADECLNYFVELRFVLLFDAKTFRSDLCVQILVMLHMEVLDECVKLNLG